MTTTTEHMTYTDGDLVRLHAKWKAAEVKQEAARQRRIKQAMKRGTYSPPVAWNGPGSAQGSLIVEQHGVKLSGRQQAQEDDAAEAVEAIGAGLSPVPIKAADYEAVKADVRETIRAGKVEKTTEAARLKTALSPRALMTRSRKVPEAIPGTEHLDAKQRATLADMRRRLRESETALAAYLRDCAKPNTIATAEQWVRTRRANLESKMRQFGVPITTTEQ